MSSNGNFNLGLLKKKKEKKIENKHKNYVYDNTIHFTWFYNSFLFYQSEMTMKRQLENASSGKCPIYSVTGKLDARICQATSSTECPTEVYKSNLNFNCKT